jgi:hypothetical protein
MQSFLEKAGHQYINDERGTTATDTEHTTTSTAHAHLTKRMDRQCGNALFCTTSTQSKLTPLETNVSTATLHIRQSFTNLYTGKNSLYFQLQGD